jgi:hypothetical protein
MRWKLADSRAAKNRFTLLTHSKFRLRPVLYKSATTPHNIDNGRGREQSGQSN